jgi:hypothetical protein
MNRIFFSAFLLLSQATLAQNPLPDFSVTTRGKGKIIIGWYHTYPKVSQISIQRSADSLRNYKTILTVPDASVPQNGFVDTKAPTEFQFYRLFIVLDSGKYIFTKPKRAFWDTSAVAQKTIQRPQDNGRVVPVKPVEDKTYPNAPADRPAEPERFFYVKKRDTLLAQLSEKDLKKLRDSILYKTKDTLSFIAADTLVIKPFVPKEVYKPSLYVFTSKDGNVTISLPDVAIKKYSVRFFEDNATPLFEVKHVTESPLTLDKANFLHAGWFRFELYENGTLKEKHRFYISKDF